jgi:menaquinone-dependent protoporphyrinogen oxidase
MTESILVAHASKHGSTHEVADAVAATLREHGLATNVQAAAEVDHLEGYDGVVLGAGLYMGRVHPDARRFLKHHGRALEGLPVAVFAMGPLTLSEKDVQGSEKQLQHALDKVPSVHPIATAVFGGVIHQEELHFPFSHMPETDARDWTAIEAWAHQVAAELQIHRLEPA